MIDTLIRPLVLSFDNVTAIVANRVVPILVPEGWNLPALTYQIIAASADPTFDTAGFTRTRVQFDCYGESYADASSLRQALDAAINGFVGEVAGVQITDVCLIQPIDRFQHELLQFICGVEYYISCNS